MAASISRRVEKLERQLPAGVDWSQYSPSELRTFAKEFLDRNRGQLPGGVEADFEKLEEGRERHRQFLSHFIGRELNEAETNKYDELHRENPYAKITYVDLVIQEQEDDTQT